MLLFCGMDTNLYESKEITPIDLLFRVYDFVRLTPDENKWNLKSIEDNYPRLFRYKQILSILKAYGFENKAVEKNDSKYNSISYFYDGYFLRFDYNEKKDIKYNPDYNSLIKELNEERRKVYKAEKRYYENSDPELYYLFRQLKSFSLKLYDLHYYHWNGSETPLEKGFYLGFLQKAESYLEKCTFDINKILSKLIDPLERVFTKDFLIKEYDFPDIDIIEIDIENW